MMTMYWQFKIAAVAKQATTDNKHINEAMVKCQYAIVYSAKTVVKYLKQHYKLPAKKMQKDMEMPREIKKNYRVFEKIQVDIKYVDDIPEFYHDFMRFNLPKYHITARCVRTGALFIGYTPQHSTTGTSIFIYRLLNHLKKIEV